MFDMRFEVFKVAFGLWDKMVGELLDYCGQDDRIVRLVFFAAVADNKEYACRLAEIKEKIGKYFTGIVPVVSLVAQRPLDCGLCMEVHQLEQEFDGTVTPCCWKDIYYLRVETDGCRRIFLGNQGGEDATVCGQAAEVFTKITEVLGKEQMELGNIVRQWNYIERITDYSNGAQRYQDFNNVRSRFYSLSEWKAGYPAATGIGAQWGGVQVELDAVSFSGGRWDMIPLDNDWQIAAHVYSSNVLKEGTSGLETPKFERGKAVTDGRRGMLYVSGTAAIRGEDSLHGVGVLVQTGVTMENIGHLISVENLNKSEVSPGCPCRLEVLRIYLKDAGDVTVVKTYMESVFSGVPVSYLLADICRNELLVEVEGIAVF